MDTFDNFQYENSSAYGGMSVIDDNSSIYTDNTREDTVSNIDLSSLSISDNASQSNGTGLITGVATIDEDFDAVLDDLKEEGIVDLPPHACRFVSYVEFVGFINALGQLLWHPFPSIRCEMFDMFQMVL